MKNYHILKSWKSMETVDNTVIKKNTKQKRELVLPRCIKIGLKCPKDGLQNKPKLSKTAALTGRFHANHLPPTCLSGNAQNTKDKRKPKRARGKIKTVARASLGDWGLPKAAAGWRDLAEHQAGTGVCQQAWKEHWEGVRWGSGRFMSPTPWSSVEDRLPWIVLGVEYVRAQKK